MSNIDYQNGLAVGLACGANISKEVDEFIENLPPTIENMDSSVSSSNTEFKISEVALIKVDGRLSVGCDNDIWSLPLTKYFFGLQAKGANGEGKGSKHIRAVELTEETIDGKKVRHMKAGLTTLEFFIGGAHNTTYLTFDRFDAIVSKELVAGDIITLVLMEVE